MAINTRSRIYIDGDSKTDRNFHYQLIKLFCTRLQNLADSNNGGPRPMMVNKAVTGSTIQSVQARSAINIPLFAPTHFIASVGINDAQLGVPLATSQAFFTSLLNQTAKQGIETIILGPDVWGEIWASPGNPADPAIVALNNAMAVIAAAYPLCRYIDMRNGWFSVVEPEFNLPSPGVTVGPMTSPDALGGHPNPFGRVSWNGAGMASVPITATLVRPRYTSLSPPSPGSMGVRISSQNLNGLSNGNAGYVDGNPVPLPIVNTGVGGTACNIVTATGTAPIFRKTGGPTPTGSLTALSALDANSVARLIRSEAFTSQPQPFVIACIFKPHDFTANQIYTDSSGANSVSQATLLTTGILQQNAGTPQNFQESFVSKWQSMITLFNGNNSLNVLNGSLSGFGVCGSKPHDQISLFANSSGILPVTGLIEGIYVWWSSLGNLPNLLDVSDWIDNLYGRMPQPQ